MERTQTTSTSIKRPWGGQLDPEIRPSRVSKAMDGLSWLGALLKKWTELCLLTTIVAVAMTYEFSLNLPALTGIHDWFYKEGSHRASWAYFYEDQLSPYIQGVWPVLESKFSSWFLVGIAMIAGYVSLRVLESLCGRPFMTVSSQVPEQAKARPHRLIPMIAIAVFLMYSLASVLFWAPQPPPEAQLLSGGGATTAVGMVGKLSALGGAGFFQSMTAWLQVSFALFFFLVAEDILRERTLVNKIFALIVILGVFNALVVLFQKVGVGPVVNILPRWLPDETRNNLGAFIGHNTGVSSYLMAPMLISLMWMMSVQPRRRQLFRMLLMLCVMIMMLALFLAQSRAVLPILFVCTVMLFFMLHRRSVFLSKTRLSIWLPVAIVFIVLTQLVPSSYNPLYRRDVTLQKRVHEFTAKRLLTETRLRILAVSLADLIPNSPWIGYGWGTFQYVYPEAQGQYFQRNSRSILSPTDRRSYQAHNEYLQTFIETGAIGLAIALIGLGFLLHGGWGIFRRTLMPHHIAAQAAVFCSIVAYLLHCLVDFPLRIPPLALTLVIMLAIWSAGDRLWLFPVRPPAKDEEIPGASPAASGTALARFSRTPLGSAILLAAGLIVVAGAGLAVILISESALNRFQTAEVLVLRATIYMGQYQTNPGTASQALELAWNDAYVAQRTLWISGPVNRAKAYADNLRAFAAYERADQLAQQKQLPLAAKTRSLADVLARTALTDLNMTLSEERFSNIYLIRSQLNRLIGQNSEGDKRREYMTRAQEDLYRAVSMNPGDPNAIFILLQVLEQDSRANYTEIVRYLGILHYFHPEFFEKNVLSRVADALSMAEDRDALEKMQQIAEAVKGNPDYQTTYAYTLLRNGNIEQAKQIMQEQMAGAEGNKTRRDFLQMLKVNIAIEQKDYPEARKQLLTLGDSSSVPAILIKTYTLYLPAETDEQLREKSRLRDEIEAAGKKDAINYQIAGVTAFCNFHDIDESVYWLEKRRAAPAPAPPMDVQGRTILAKGYAQLGKWDDLNKTLAENDCKGSTEYSTILCRGISNSLWAAMQKAKQDEPAPAQPVPQP